MNVFSFTGNLGADCRKGNAGSTAVCNFVVAVKSGYGEKEQTVWVDCALWGKQAESRLPDFLIKGQQVAVSGELGTRQYEKDGKTGFIVTCRVNSINLVGGKPEGQQQAPRPQQQAQRPAPAANNSDTEVDDIPF